MTEVALETERPQLMHRWRVILGLTFLVGCIVAGFYLFSNTQAVLDWVESLGRSAPLLIAMFLTVAVVLCMPTPLLKVFVGALFGFWMGLWINFIASMVGGVIAFLLGRWLFRDSILAAISKDPKLQRIEASLGEESFRISVLVRLSPIIPDEWVNYIMSAGPVSLRVFIISNVSSVIYSLIYAYYGMVIGEVALRSSGLAGFADSTGGIVMLLVGLVATIVATAVVTKVTMKALGDIIGEEE